MHLEAELVHAEPGQRIVRVCAYQGGKVLGSSLGEAATAELAEDRARKRVLDLLQATEERGPKPAQALAAAAAPLQAIEPQPQQAEEGALEPEDWSGELARLDLQLQRLCWSREQEAVYLERAFGHPSRNRLTHYGDLLTYLQALEAMAPGSDPAAIPIPLRRRDLLEQCDQLLGQLKWDSSLGRTFLEKHFSLASRQQLNDSQLLQFNMLLEGELISC